MTATMTIEDTFTIKSRGLVLAGHPSAEPAVGMVARLPDGRAWTVRGVERQGMKRWHPGDPSAVLIGDAGDAPPQIGDVVELVGEGPAASTEPEGPRVVAGVTVYLDGKRLAENVEALGESFIVGPLSPHTTNTFTAPPADLRSLHDAIGQAIETGAGRVARFNGGPVVVTRDEMLFSPTVTMDASGGLPATVTIAADSKHLRTLRAAVDEARETGKAPPREWGKGRRVAVERVGEAPTVAATPSEAEPVRYDGNAGGAQAWRWEVEGS